MEHGNSEHKLHVGARQGKRQTLSVLQSCGVGRLLGEEHKDPFLQPAPLAPHIDALFRTKNPDLTFNCVDARKMDSPASWCLISRIESATRLAIETSRPSAIEIRSRWLVRTIDPRGVRTIDPRGCSRHGLWSSSRIRPILMRQRTGKGMNGRTLQVARTEVGFQSCQSRLPFA